MLLVRISVKNLEQKEDFVSKISDNMEELNSVICSKQMPSVKMRTTIALLSIVNQEITTAHIGDTRIYHFVDCKITEVTFDHSVSQLAVLSGEIKQEELHSVTLHKTVALLKCLHGGHLGMIVDYVECHSEGVAENDTGN